MRLFEHLAVVGSSEASDPLVLRSVPEEFGLRVHLYRLYQRRNVEDFSAGRGVPRGELRGVRGEREGVED